MANVTVIFGALLTLLGILGYLVTGMASVTALIPAFFGIPVIVLGWLGRNPDRLKLTMHIAVTLTLIGFFGTIQGLPKLLHILQGIDVARPAAVIVQSAMALICIVHVALSINSFVQVRRRKSASESEA
jgi:hypothetical protein